MMDDSPSLEKSQKFCPMYTTAPCCREKCEFWTTEIPYATYKIEFPDYTGMCCHRLQAEATSFMAKKDTGMEGM